MGRVVFMSKTITKAQRAALVYINENGTCKLQQQKSVDVLERLGLVSYDPSRRMVLTAAGQAVLA